MAELDILGTLSQLMQVGNTGQELGPPQSTTNFGEYDNSLTPPFQDTMIPSHDLTPQPELTREEEEIAMMQAPEDSPYLITNIKENFDKFYGFGDYQGTGPMAPLFTNEDSGLTLQQTLDGEEPNLDISDQGQVAEAANTEIMAKAQKAGEVAQEKGKAVIEGGSKAENFDLWNMVKSAGQQVGDVMEIGFDAWMDLSPSTKVALIGSAATAYAYKRGWEKTAGDVAKTSAGMYLNMYGKEQDLEGQKSKQLADAIKGQTDATNKANAKAVEAAQKTAGSDAINRVAKSDVFKEAAQEAGLVYGTNAIPEEDRALLSGRLADIYRAMVGDGRIDTKTGFDTWASNRANITAALKLLQADQQLPE